MYFKNRAEAGRVLAAKLQKYDRQQCVVVALNAGAVLIGAQIAMRVHANLMVLMNDNIILPGEIKPLATMTTDTLTYNSAFSSGEREEMINEYHGVIDGQRLEKFHNLNRLLSDGGNVNPKYLRRHVVILVSDGLQTGSSLEVASDYLKPIKIKGLVIATPLASVEAVDKMHLLGDDLYCLNVAENLMETNHYYEENGLPDHEQTLKIIRNISMTWEVAPTH